jgi:hypothetical protein
VFTLHCFKSLSLLLLDAKTTVLCTFLIKKPEQLMKIETPKKITWPEITVLLGSAASIVKHMLLCCLRKLYLGKLRISYISIKKEQSYFVVLI